MRGEVDRPKPENVLPVMGVEHMARGVAIQHNNYIKVIPLVILYWKWIE